MDTVIISPVSGARVGLSAEWAAVRLSPNGALYSLIVVLPAVTAARTLVLATDASILNFSLLPAGAQTLSGAPIQLAAGEVLTLTYDPLQRLWACNLGGSLPSSGQDSSGFYYTLNGNPLVVGISASPSLEVSDLQLVLRDGGVLGIPASLTLPPTATLLGGANSRFTSLSLDPSLALSSDGVLAASIGSGAAQVASGALVASVQALAVAALPATGGAMTGNLALAGPPIAPLHAANRGYVDAAIATVAATAVAGLSLAQSVQITANAALPRSGGAMTGNLVLAFAPTLDLHAVPKMYSDAGDAALAASLAATDGRAVAAQATASAALVRGANLADLVSTANARFNLGLGPAALLPVGTSTNTVAAGDDLRIVNALQAYQLGVPNGIAALDSSGKVSIAQLPSSIAGGLAYQGTWNAATNYPPLASGSGSQGWYFICATAGTTTLDGITQWSVGDWAVFSGSVWHKLDGVASEVLAVLGQTGSITLAQLVGGGVAPLLSPAFAGSPTAPTPSLIDTSTALATTAWVRGQAYINAAAPNIAFSGGTLDNVIIGGATPAAATFSTLSITGAQAAATVLAAPAASSGSPTFRQLGTADILGLGSLAAQAAGAVAITGGTLDGVTVGATSPGPGTFSSLTLTAVQPKGSVFAAPAAGAGVPGFRTLTPADIPFAAPGPIGGTTPSTAAFTSVQLGAKSFVTTIDDNLWLTVNAYYDGANWQRIDTTKAAHAINVQATDPIPYDGTTHGTIFWVAAAGANPIAPAFGAVGGWQTSFLATEYKDFVLGGAGIEIDGNGTTPYGRVLHTSAGNASPKRTGMASNLFATLAGVDDPTQPSWFWGRTDDSWSIARAPAGQTTAAGLATLLSVAATGSIVIGAATGGSQGAGTINATGLFVNGAAVGIAGGYVLPAATPTSLGGVIIPASSGLAVDGPGHLSVTWAVPGAIGATTPSTAAFTTLAVSGTVTFSGTGAAQVPAGTTAQQPAGVAGMARFNSQTLRYEFYNGTAWANHVRLAGDTMTGALTVPSITASGGTLDGVAIGATTPGTGAFTTLAASGALTAGSFVVGAATGANKGAGTINATGLYVNGVAVSTSSGYTLPPSTGSSLGGVIIPASGGLTVDGSGNAGVNWAAPGAIGGTVPAAGTFTTLTAASALLAPSLTRASGTLSLGTAGSAGVGVQLLGAHADASVVQTTPATGFAYTVPNNVSTVQFTPAGALASGAITLPANPIAGQVLYLCSTQTIGGLAIAASAGQTINGTMPTVLPAGESILVQYQGTAWFCLLASGNAAIVGGTINGAVIGGASPQPGTFTAVTTASLSLTGSQSARYVFAAPSGAAGAPGFRQLANTDITGLGTLSTQNATAVTLTGGSIDSIPIGATTASTVRATSLALTGSQTASTVLAAPAGSAGAPSFRQLTVSDLTGLGTMATQAAANVAISGGSISNVAFGALTSLSFTNATGAKLNLYSTSYGIGLNNYELCLFSDVGSTLAWRYGSDLTGTVGFLATTTGINGTAIGATTPSTGSFTSLTASGTCSINGYATTAFARTMGGTYTWPGPSVAPGTYTMTGYAPYAFTITRVIYNGGSASGTSFVLTLKNASATVGGVSGVTASAGTTSTASLSGTNVAVAAGAAVTISVTSLTGAPADGWLTIVGTKT